MSEQRRVFEDYADIFNLDTTWLNERYRSDITERAWQSFLSGWED